MLPRLRDPFRQRGQAAAHLLINGRAMLVPHQSKNPSAVLGSAECDRGTRDDDRGKQSSRHLQKLWRQEQRGRRSDKIRRFSRYECYQPILAMQGLAERLIQCVTISSSALAVAAPPGQFAIPRTVHTVFSVFS